MVGIKCLACSVVVCYFSVQSVSSVQWRGLLWSEQAMKWRNMVVGRRVMARTAPCAVSLRCSAMLIPVFCAAAQRAAHCCVRRAAAQVPCSPESLACLCDHWDSVKQLRMLPHDAHEKLCIGNQEIV